MPRIPGHLLDLARIADQTPADIRPEATARIAALILDHLPHDEPALCDARALRFERERLAARRADGAARRRALTERNA